MHKNRRIHKNRHRRWPVGGAAVAAATLLAACTSSTASTPSTGSTGSTGTANAAASGSLAAGAPIVVAGIGSVQIAGEAGMDKGFEARVARTNAEGGVAGHKIVYKALYDDSGQTATDTSLIRQLIQKDQVFAIGPVASISFDPGTMSLLAANHTPMIGYSFTPVSCQVDWFFPVIGGGCYVAAAKVGGPFSVANWRSYLAATGKQAGDVRLAFVLTNSTANAIETPAGEQAAKQIGMVPVYARDSIPQVPPTNYTPYVQAVLATNPNLIDVGIPYAQELSFIQTAKSLGYKGDFYAQSGLPPDLFQGSSNAAVTLDGSYQGSLWPLSTDNTTASKQEIADFTKAGIYQNNTFSFGQSVGYWTADQFVSMLEATAKTGPLTQQRFEQTVNEGSYTYHGPVGYLTQLWPASHEGPTAGCIALSKVNATAKTVQPAVPFTCYPLVTLEGLPKMIP
jgi:branched-chain amino acid transport system substrate-binding protein